MKKKRLLSGIFLTGLMMSVGASATAYLGPKGQLNRDENQWVWEQYCEGVADSTDIPRPNYSNSDVKKAAEILSKKVAKMSFYFYSGPAKAYGLKKSKGEYSKPKATPKWVTGHANAYLTILCGEFRDRATLVEEKIKWINRLRKLPVTKQAEIDPTQEIWHQVSAHSYRPYLSFSSALWYAKKRDLTEEVDLGSYRVDAPVTGTTVCETKYIFHDYVSRGIPFDSLGEYRAGLEKFRDSYCSPDDTDYYYDFRGDSNFKPNTPESNGMIWHANSITRHCKDTNTSKGNAVTDLQCQEYFRHPFASRWNAARAGLAAWVLHSRNHDSRFANDNATTVIFPHFEGHLRPFSFAYQFGSTPKDEFLAEFESTPALYRWPGLGLNEITGFDGLKDPNFDLVYERLRDAVNRHTNWYHSGYDDLRGLKRDQAYSPFVASSYEMSESDAFTAPGYTVKSKSDGRKHWMYVFRIHKDQWYTTQSARDGKPVDFDRHWFDETSLGTTSLAKSEKAWDRLGTALEGELDSILYLHNITQYGSVEIDDLEQ